MVLLPSHTLLSYIFSFSLKVPISFESLNCGDSFILDGGMKVNSNMKATNYEMRASVLCFTSYHSHKLQLLSFLFHSFFFPGVCLARLQGQPDGEEQGVYISSKSTNILRVPIFPLLLSPATHFSHTHITHNAHLLLHLQAMSMAQALDDERGGRPDRKVFNEGMETDEFWKAIGGKVCSR